jgi:Zn-dependent hydrolases, including glyoxylases
MGVPESGRNAGAAGSLGNASAVAAPEVTGFYDPVTHTISYVVRDPASPRCAIIDPVLDYDPDSGRTRHDSADAIIAFVEGSGLAAQWVLETHVHADHLSAANYIKRRLGGRLGIGARIPLVQKVFAGIFNPGADFVADGRQFDRLFEDGERFDIGGLTVTVLHTPGHTPACVTYLIGDAAFVGDTLFMPDYGTARCDFPGGDARQLYRSIRRILALPPSTRLFLCHDYQTPDRTEPIWETTVARQRQDNIHVHDGVDEDAFVALRTARDAKLAIPKLMLPSVQVNMRAGALPPPEDNGVRYLKIPLDSF